jgi:Flp pilus assembly protein TadD
MFNIAAGKALFWIAQLLIMLGPLGRRASYPLLTAAASLCPQDTRPEGWMAYISAIAASRRGRLDDAIVGLRQASRLLPGSAAVRANLGIALAMTGEWDAAIDVLEAATRDDAAAGSERGVWSALAWAYLRTGRYPKVRDTFERAHRCRAVSPDLELLVLVARGTESSRLDVAAIGRLVRRRPRMLPLVLEFAEWQALRGQRRLARVLLTALPDEIEAQGIEVTGHSAINRGAYDVALWAAGELYKLRPEDPACAMLRSEVALRRGQGEVAVTQAQRAVQLAPKDVRALEQLGRAQLLCGDPEAAARAFVECLATGSDSAVAGGVVAMALLARGQTRETQVVFSVGRRGDALGCAYAHAAHALLMARGERWDEAVKIAAMAVEALDDLPSWAATPRVLRDVRWALGEALTETARSETEFAAAAAEMLARGVAPAADARGEAKADERPPA